ncbi:MAG: Rossmann fold nucleotide-binding protein [Verrucomicrobiota bacterium]
MKQLGRLTLLLFCWADLHGLVRRVDPGFSQGMSDTPISRPRQICVLGSAEPGSPAFELAAAAGELLAKLGITVVSGCGSPATRVAAERALAAGGTVVSIVPSDDIGLADWPCSVLIPCGMGDARNLLMALAGDACLVIGGRAGTISEVCLAWLHHRPLLPLTGCGGWSDQLEQNPPDERKNSPILPWGSMDELKARLTELGFIAGRAISAGA